MMTEREIPEGDETYFEEDARPSRHVLDASLLNERLEVLPTRAPLVFGRSDTVTDAMRAMQREGRGCVLITEDGTLGSPMIGIFTERDVLQRIVDRGRNPASLPLGDVMTADPESVPREASIAWVLNQMAVGGFRHIPVVDEAGCPVFIISVRDIVQFIVEFFPREILNLPPEYRGGRVRAREGA
jgi:CBS domain-containing protein